MGKLNSFHIIETSIWLFITLVFFIFSFEFNQNIEIYRFGATGWPRAVLVLLTLVSLGNFYHLWRNGDAIQPGRVGFSSDDNEEEIKIHSPTKKRQQTRAQKTQNEYTRTTLPVQ